MNDRYGIPVCGHCGAQIHTRDYGSEFCASCVRAIKGQRDILYCKLKVHREDCNTCNPSELCDIGTGLYDTWQGAVERVRDIQEALR